MTDTIEIEAKSISEAVEKACEYFCVSRDKLSIEILSDGSSGFLGIGSRKARILAALINFNAVFEDDIKEIDGNKKERTPHIVSTSERERANRGRDFLIGLLNHMGINRGASYKITAENITLCIEGESDPLIIGRMGQNIDAIQHILNKAVDHERKEKPIIVEIGDYRKRRRNTLIAIAKRAGEKVRKSQKELAINNMKAHDRRIIHLTLENNPYVTTRSIGEGDERKLIIEPAKKIRREQGNKK
ncbi:MAG: Jag N-terminal domain-containing protein [Deltaproteobacteria bacterium]|nr:Jag N-terminal domain-containing protein [Deltaproteobacteria bacterium]